MGRHSHQQDPGASVSGLRYRRPQVHHRRCRQTHIHNRKRLARKLARRTDSGSDRRQAECADLSDAPSTSRGELTGQVALVTGGVRRIGRSIALALAREGAAIAVNAKSSHDEAADTVREVEAAGGAARVIMGDVTSEAEVARMVKEIAAMLGTVDILINNAAVRRDDAFTAMSFADWRLVMAVVLDGAFLMSRAVIPSMLAKGHGTIVNIGGVPPPPRAPGGGPCFAAQGRPPCPPQGPSRRVCGPAPPARF